MPPIVDLKNMQRFQRENEYRQWIGLGKLFFQKEYFFQKRMVQTQAILFLKSMSERGRSDIERY